MATTQILVNVDQASAIAAGYNTESSKVRVPVDVTTLSPDHRGFVAKYINQEKLSMPDQIKGERSGRTQSFAVVTPTHDGFVAAINNFFETDVRLYEEAYNFELANARRQVGKFHADVDNRRLTESAAYVHENVIIYGKQYNLSYCPVYAPRAELSFCGLCVDGINKSLQPEIDEILQSREYKSLEAEALAATEKNREKRLAELIAKCDKERAEDKRYDILVQAWLSMPSKDGIDREMVKKGYAPKSGDMLDDIIGQFLDIVKEESKHYEEREMDRAMFVRVKSALDNAAISFANTPYHLSFEDNVEVYANDDGYEEMFETAMVYVTIRYAGELLCEKRPVEITI